MRDATKRGLVLLGLVVLVAPVGCSKSDTAGTTNTSAASGAGGSGGGAYASSTTKAGSGGAPATTAAGGSGGPGAPTVVAKDLKFDPAQVKTKAGTTVAFTSGDTLHEPTAGTKDKPDPSVFELSITKGQTAVTPALKAGTIAYFCAIHPSMVGEITVS